jgi:hypothetical protein
MYGNCSAGLNTPLQRQHWLILAKWGQLAASNPIYGLVKVSRDLIRTLNNAAPLTLITGVSPYLSLYANLLSATRPHQE